MTKQLEEQIKEILCNPDNWRKEVWYLEGHEVATQTLDIPKATAQIRQLLEEYPCPMKERLKQIKDRLARLEQEVFGMTNEEAQLIVDSYISAAEENPHIEASEQVKKAEKVLEV